MLVMLARKLVVKVQMTTIDSFCLAFAQSIVAERYCLMSSYCDLRYKARVHTHTRTQTQILFKDRGR